MFIVGFLRRDYGAAGLFMLARRGLLDPIQIVVSLVTITLFVPCVAQFFVMIKERGLKTTLAMVAFIFPFAFLAGGILNMILRALGVSL
jgi:ferrous iron transport protein B